MPNPYHKLSLKLPASLKSAARLISNNLPTTKTQALRRELVGLDATVRANIEVFRKTRADHRAVQQQLDALNMDINDPRLSQMMELKVIEREMQRISSTMLAAAANGKHALDFFNERHTSCPDWAARKYNALVMLWNAEKNIMAEYVKHHESRGHAVVPSQYISYGPRPVPTPIPVHQHRN